MASPSRQIGDVSFVTNSNNNNHLKLFLHSESRGNMKTLTLSLASHIIVVCGVSLTLSTTALKSQPPHQLQVRGWPGATRPRTWFHLTQHFRLWVNYISLSAQVGILCVFLTLGREDDQKTWLTIFWWQYSFCGIQTFYTVLRFGHWTWRSLYSITITTNIHIYKQQ